MIVEGVMTELELEQESHSKTLELLLLLQRLSVTQTRACVVLCLYTLLFCPPLLNAVFPFLLTLPKVAFLLYFHYSLWVF